jgi:hypothetical protein
MSLQKAADKAIVTNSSATEGPFPLLAGEYAMTAIASAWNSGSVKLQRQAADGSSWVDVQAFTANGFAAFPIPGGVYQVAIASATGVYADVSAVITANA